MRLAADLGRTRVRRLGVVDGGSPRGAARHSKAAPPGVPPSPPLRVRQKGGDREAMFDDTDFAGAEAGSIGGNCSKRILPLRPFLRPFYFVGFRPNTRQVIQARSPG